MYALSFAGEVELNIVPKNIKVSDLVEGYVDKGDDGVRGYGGELNIRPAYQREFVYDKKQRAEVIDSVRKGFPLNSMYWVRADDGFELLDGQQRTISICQYVAGDFSVVIDSNPHAFHNLQPDKKQQILDYELSIYVCEGEPSEKLDWFRIVNFAGEKLTKQELRNAIYAGPWLTDAKGWFSRSNCQAQAIGEKYVTGSPIRQEILEAALEWITGEKGDKLGDYMADHQHDENASALWQHFQEVIAWIERTFPTYRAKMMKGLDWGKFYREHKDDKLNAAKLEKQIAELIDNDEVDSKKGIYEYILTGNEKTLNLRTFDEKTKVKTYEKQNGICPDCKKKYEYGQMEADHIVPWHKNGKTVPENCMMLCMLDNRTKGGR